VTHEDAIQRVLKLQALTEARGATSHEAKVAAAKADRLIRRFGLDRREVHRARPSERPRSVFVPDWPPKWSFDPSTGVASPNVKVHEHHNRRNWRIEIFEVGANDRWAAFAGRAERGSLHR
jgi:hypothetical protein